MLEGGVALGLALLPLSYYWETRSGWGVRAVFFRGEFFRLALII